MYANSWCLHASLLSLPGTVTEGYHPEKKNQKTKTLLNRAGQAFPILVQYVLLLWRYLAKGEVIHTVY